MMGRSKDRRWVEDFDASDAEVSPAISVTHYLGAVRCGTQWTSPLTEATVVGGTCVVAAVELHAGCRSKRNS